MAGLPGPPTGFPPPPPVGYGQPMAGMPMQGYPPAMPPGMPPGMPQAMPPAMPPGMPPGMPQAMPPGMPPGMPHPMPPRMPQAMPPQAMPPQAMPPTMPHSMPSGMQHAQQPSMRPSVPPAMAGMAPGTMPAPPGMQGGVPPMMSSLPGPMPVVPGTTSIPPSALYPPDRSGAAAAVRPPRMVRRTVICEYGMDLPSPPDLYAGFEGFGLVEKMRVRQEPDASITVSVTYTSSAAAARAVTTKQVTCGGEPRKVSLSQEQELVSPYDSPALCVWVGLSDREDIAQDDVGRTLASQFGSVQMLEMHRESPTNNHAIVAFTAQESADSCMADRSIDIKSHMPAIEWFHPSLRLGVPAAPVTPAPLPTPKVMKVIPTPDVRKLVFRYSFESPAMEEELVEALQQRYGEAPEVVVGMEGADKMAFVTMGTMGDAQRCKEDFDSGLLTLPAVSELTVDWCLLKNVGHDAPVTLKAPSPSLCLHYPSREAAESVGCDHIRNLFETHIGGVDGVTVKDRFIIIDFQEVSASMEALDRWASLQVPGNPTARYTKRQSPAARENDEPPEKEQPKTNGRGQSTALIVAGPASEFGGAIPAYLPQKTNVPPPDTAVQKLVDRAAAKYAKAGVMPPEGVLILRTQNAGYFLYKSDCDRLGVDNSTEAALEKVRLAAEAAAKRIERANGRVDDPKPDHCLQCDEPGQIPFTNDMKMLILAEDNMTFSAALLERLQNGANMIVTTPSTKEELIARFGNSTAENIQKLVDAEVKVGYGFDPTIGATYEGLIDMQFDAIVANYPKAPLPGGGHTPDAEANKNYLRKIMKHTPAILASRGKVYISQLTGAGYNDWDVPKTALRADTGLRLIDKFPMRTDEFPGYVPEFASYDDAAPYRNASWYLFGRKKKYEMFDKHGERDVELEMVRQSNRRARSESSEPAKKKKQKDDKDKDKEKEKEKSKDRDKEADREKDRDKGSSRKRERSREKDHDRRDRDRDRDRDKDRDRDRDRDRRDRDRRDRRDRRR
ncbi:Splicing factor U2af large subunit A [Diplonema papillatum]|nr:Splicing factor U2af large subunit A [Diplonema papillatum]